MRDARHTTSLLVCVLSMNASALATVCRAAASDISGATASQGICALPSAYCLRSRSAVSVVVPLLLLLVVTLRIVVSRRLVMAQWNVPFVLEGICNALLGFQSFALIALVRVKSGGGHVRNAIRAIALTVVFDTPNNHCFFFGDQEADGWLPVWVLFFVTITTLVCGGIYYAVSARHKVAKHPAPPPSARQHVDLSSSAQPYLGSSPRPSPGRATSQVAAFGATHVLLAAAAMNWSCSPATVAIWFLLSAVAAFFVAFRSRYDPHEEAPTAKGRHYYGLITSVGIGCVRGIFGIAIAAAILESRSGPQVNDVAIVIALIATCLTAVALLVVAVMTTVAVRKGAPLSTASETLVPNDNADGTVSECSLDSRLVNGSAHDDRVRGGGVHQAVSPPSVAVTQTTDDAIALAEQLNDHPDWAMALMVAPLVLWAMVVANDPSATTGFAVIFNPLLAAIALLLGATVMFAACTTIMATLRTSEEPNVVVALEQSPVNDDVTREASEV
jgi:hypothetical protein